MKTKFFIVLALLILVMGCSAIGSSIKPDQLETFFSEKICSEEDLSDWIDNFF